MIVIGTLVVFGGILVAHLKFGLFSGNVRKMVTLKRNMVFTQMYHMLYYSLTWLSLLVSRTVKVQ